MADGWLQAPLGDLLTKPPKNGYSPKDVPEWSGRLMLGLGCLGADGFRPLQLKNAPRNDPKLESAELADGDVLISRSNTRSAVGFAGVFKDVGVPCSYPDLMMRLCPRPSEIDSEYLVRFLLSAKGRRQIEAAACGTSGSMVKLNKAAVQSLDVPVPPLPEQRQIAEVLDTVDEAIRRTEQIIAKLKQVKQGLLHDLLTRGIDDNGELRDPDRHPEQFKDSPLGRIPKGWEVLPLTNVAEVRSGIAKNENRAVRNPTKVHYLRVANVQDGYLDLDDMSEIVVGRDDVERYTVLPGDVLMNEGGDLDKLGRGAIWEGQYDPCVHQNHVFVVRCRPPMKPTFLNAWTGSAPARRYFMVAGKQTTNLASINKTALGRLPVVLPGEHEQAAIVSVLDEHDRRVGVEESQVDKLRLLKGGLMDDLLTGRVRVIPLLKDAAE